MPGNSREEKTLQHAKKQQHFTEYLMQATDRSDFFLHQTNELTYQKDYFSTIYLASWFKYQSAFPQVIQMQQTEIKTVRIYTDIVQKTLSH